VKKSFLSKDIKTALQPAVQHYRKSNPPELYHKFERIEWEAAGYKRGEDGWVNMQSGMPPGDQQVQAVEKAIERQMQSASQYMRDLMED
jgi:hypothetical protein